MNKRQNLSAIVLNICFHMIRIHVKTTPENRYCRFCNKKEA